MSIHVFHDKVPTFGAQVFVHPDATVIGDVVLGEGANVWPGAVLRGDVERISLGPGVSFQDGCVAHCDPGFPLVAGAGCVFGHGAIVHGATVGAGCLIGMGSTLLNGCEIGEGSIVGAGALVTEGKRVPPRSLVVGAPARVVRQVTDDELARSAELSARYVRRSLAYLEAGLGADLSAFRR